MNNKNKSKYNTKTLILTSALILLMAFNGCIGQEEPKGGTLIIAANADPVTLDPSFITGILAVTTGIHLVYDNLVDYNMDFEITPNLAKSWEQQDAAGLHWRFNLEEGVKYHDGTDFNAEATKYALDRFMTMPDSPHQALYTVFDRVEAVSEYTVDIFLESPYVDFFPTLATTPIVSPTAAEEWGPEDYGVHPSGTGPFMLEEWVYDDHLTFKAFEDCWDGRPNLDEVIIQIIPDDTVRMLNLETGAVHISDIPPEQIKRMAGIDSVQLYEGTSSTYELIVLNIHREPLDNVLVRQALNYAIDREAISEIVTDGYAVPCKGPMFPGTPFWNPDMEAYDYNPEKARQLLKDAGYEEGFVLEMDVSTAVQDWAEVVQQQLSEVGITVELNMWEWGPFIQKLLGRDYTSVIVGWGGSGPTPIGLLEPWYHSQNIVAGGFNVQNIEDPRLDALLDELAETMDLDQQKEIIQEIQDIVVEEAYSVLMCYNPRYFGSTTSVKGYDAHPHWLYGHVVSMKDIGVDVYVEEEE